MSPGILQVDARRWLDGAPIMEHRTATSFLSLVIFFKIYCTLSFDSATDLPESVTESGVGMLYMSYE